MRKTLVALSLLSLMGCSALTENNPMRLPDGVNLVEQGGTAKDGVEIPYQKYRLKNGLTVVLHEDHSDPIVSVDVTYHVGSAREELGKSGFAHFFEHMMFQGSEHVGDQEHFRLITEAGGTLNGTTNRDRTNYYETVPANQLEKALWLESDRMGFLLGAVSQRKFEIQRATVKNERAQSYDNRPYGLAGERTMEALYPEGHPYSWMPIGYVEDLDRVTVNDLKDFFLRWYGPNNATLTIGGDIDPAQTLAWVNKYFGDIPAGPEVNAPEKQPVKLAKDRYVTLEDKIQQPMLSMTWPTEYQGAKSEYPLYMFASVLGSGRNSLLYQELVKTGKALSAGAYQDCGEISCTFNVYVLANQGEPLAPLRKDVMDILNGVARKGVSEKSLEEVKGQTEANAIFGLQSVAGKVSQLAEYETFYGTPGKLPTLLATMNGVTVKDVEGAFNTFIYQKPNVTLSVVPQGSSQLAAAKDNTPPPKRDFKISTVSADQLKLRETPVTFDRSIIPPVSGPVSVKVPSLYHAVLKNGISVAGTVSAETPTISLTLQMPAGSNYDPEGKAGLAELTAALVGEGTRQRTAEQLESELDKLGSSVSFSAGRNYSKLMVSTLTKNLGETLKIAREQLEDPAFNQADFNRVKRQVLEGITFDHNSPQWMARQATREVLYGNTRWEQPSDGTIESVKKLTLADVKAFYKAHYTPKGATLVAVGDIGKPALMNAVSALDSWQGPAVPAFVPPSLLPEGKQTIWLVNKPSAPQSVVRFVRRALPYDATGEMFKASLSNFNLAGNFNSRLNQNLREDKGYTYGASGYIGGGKNSGIAMFQAQVRADATVPSIEETLKELRKASTKGFTDKEVAFMRQAVGQQEALKYETPSNKAGLIATMQDFNLTPAYLDKQNRIIKTITRSELNSLASKWFNPNDYQIIVVGDAKSLKPQLEKLGIPVKMLKVEG